MGEINRAFAFPEEIRHKGKTYKLAQPDFRVKGSWEQWIEDRAWKVIETRFKRGKLDQDQYDRAVSRLVNDIAALKYSFRSQATTEALRTEEGIKKMILIRLEHANPGVEFNDELLEELCIEHMNEIVYKMQKMDTEDPNSASPPVDGAGSSESKPSLPNSSASLSTVA